MNLLAYVHLRNIHGSTGAGRVARQLVEHLSQRGDVEMRILADPGDHRRVIPIVGGAWRSYHYHFIRKETSIQQAQWFLMGSPCAERFWPEAQVVFCTAESYVPTAKAALAVTLHDAAFFEQGAHVANGAFWRQKLKWKMLYRTLARKADMFHTVSQFSADRLAHFFPEIQSRLRVVHNAVPPRFFQPASEEGDGYLREHDLSERPFVLLPRGLAHRKNADLVLRAWPHLHELYPDHQLVVTSHCDESYTARARSLGKSVKLAGFVSDEALCSLYRAARLVWFPSLYEGFGLPVLEAMACGTPVVASNSSALAEVAGKAAALVSPNSDDEHIEAISQLLDDAGACERLRVAGRLRAKNFTWDKSAQKLRGYFGDLV